MSEQEQLEIAMSRVIILEGQIEDYKTRLSALQDENLRLADVKENLTRDVLTWRYQAEHDMLTNLFRVMVFSRKVSNILRGRRHDEAPKSCLALLDVDRFKKLNDTYGHPIGDEALRSIAGVIKSEIREDDLACRMGDEFMIFFNRASEADATRITECIAAKVKTLRLGKETVRGEVHTAVSYGIVLRSDQVTTYDELYREADRLMYEMKKERNAKTT